MTAGAEESLEGTLDHVLFMNEESGYAVAVIKTDARNGDSRSITILGTLAGLEVGAGLRVRGRFEQHPRFGEQFRVLDYEVSRPAGTAALERYLASEIHGVGPALARRIAEHFGERLGEVLDTAPERVREVSGVGKVVAARIAVAWRDVTGLRELTVFLRGHGLAGSHARRILKEYGRNALDIVRADPYLLARTIHGIGFRTADTIAAKLGIPRNSLPRARAAILYLLERMRDDGHVYAPREQLEEQFRTGLEMDSGLLDEALAQLADQRQIVIENLAEHAAVYLAAMHEAETTVASRLRTLSGNRPMAKDVAERALAAALRDSELNAEQARALRFALSAGVTVITGGPGTGKTTLLRTLLRALDEARLKPMLGAPTGRAARRLQEATGRDAKTLHRLLEYSPESGDFVRNEQFPLRTNYLVVDEASMMDLELAASLLRALPPNSALVLVGDRDQLPSVGPGSVLKDVIASGLVAVAELREVFRQARASLIVSNAHQINRGAMPDITNAAEGDFFFFERAAPEDVIGTIKQLTQQRLVGRFGIRDSREVQVLTPMNRGPLGAQALNQELQALLNPAGRELRAGDRILREGDRVIQLRNDYDKGVFNGSIGRIISVDVERGRIGVAFEETSAEYDASELDEVGLAYAITVHKSQGSQYPAVVMPMHPSHYLMLRRNLLYTAITRAERVCVLVGTRSALAQAVRNQDERLRFSALAGRLRID